MAFGGKLVVFMYAAADDDNNEHDDHDEGDDNDDDDDKKGEDDEVANYEDSYVEVGGDASSIVGILAPAHRSGQLANVRLVRVRFTGGGRCSSSLVLK